MWILQTLVAVLWILGVGESYPVRRLLATMATTNGNFSSDLAVAGNSTQQQTGFWNSSARVANSSEISGVQNKNEMTSVLTAVPETAVPETQNKISLSSFSLIGTVIQAIFGFAKSEFLKKQLQKIVPVLNDSQAQIQKQYPQTLYRSLTAKQIVENMITAQDFINEKRKLFEALRAQSSL